MVTCLEAKRVQKTLFTIITIRMVPFRNMHGIVPVAGESTRNIRPISQRWSYKNGNNKPNLPNQTKNNTVFHKCCIPPFLSKIFQYKVNAHTCQQHAHHQYGLILGRPPINISYNRSRHPQYIISIQDPSMRTL